jgi:TRAP-type C4-dicarboxylate transport system substrate-binding protein
MFTRQWKGAQLIFLSLLVAIVLIFACAKLTPAEAASSQKPIEMKMAHYQPEQRVLMVGVKWWGDQVRARTSGRIVIKHYFGGTLARAKEIYPLLSRGGLELGTPAPSYNVSELPLFNFVGDYPYQSLGELFYVMPKLVKEVAALAAEWKKINVIPLSYGGLPPYGIVSRKKLERLDEVKNLKIRVWGKNVPRRVTKLGMVPLSTPSSEIYEAMAKGTVDCSLSPSDQHRSLGLWESAKYHLKGDFIPALFAAQPVMNLTAFNRLEPELRQILMDLQADHLKKLIQLVEETDARDEKFLKEKGVNFIYLSKSDNKRLQQVAMEVWEEQAAEMTAKGFGAEIKEIKAALERVKAEYRKTH